jgi:hypothetical protein
LIYERQIRSTGTVFAVDFPFRFEPVELVVPWSKPAPLSFVRSGFRDLLAPLDESSVFYGLVFRRAFSGFVFDSLIASPPRLSGDEPDRSPASRGRRGRPCGARR